MPTYMLLLNDMYMFYYRLLLHLYSKFTIYYITSFTMYIDPGTPYQVTVVAFTNAGRGALNDYIVFFSEELIPEMLPTDVSYTRLNNVSINVTWNPLSLKDFHRIK